MFDPTIVIIAATRQYFGYAKHTIADDVRRVYLKRGSKASKEFLDEVKKSDLVISADSGPMHLAYILHKDIIAYFSKTAPEWVIDDMANIYVQRDARMRDKYCQYADNGMCKTMECMNANFRGRFLKDYVYSNPSNIKRENYCLVEV